MKILHLSLRKEPFDVMISGEKTIEFRHPSEWLKSRLKQEYTHVQFTNGYGKDRPYFICELKEVKNVNHTHSETISEPWPLTFVKYSNGLKVNISGELIWLYLGKIIKGGNLSIEQYAALTNMDIEINPLSQSDFKIEEYMSLLVKLTPKK